MAMFTLNEEKLRQEFATDDESWIEPFDPMKIDADELHRLVECCLDGDVIEAQEERACVAIYPLSISDPEPLLSVNPGAGPLLLGASIAFDPREGKGDEVEESLIVLRAVVEAANALYGESEIAKTATHDIGSEQERCENCLRVHGPLQACLIGVLAGCVEDREAIEPITAEELAAIEVDSLWDRFGGPAVDYLEALIVDARADRGAGPDGVAAD